ncbi:probable serine hydrolase [Sitophilus oryzae]|uniref:Probable serine hydrolase n=1 Tax=Sitophilus oryzae TaxID=7048 RepID=A0A6J2X6L1_SITOR|nr:probable serine hydrolase [Sitophilus oryzae]
MSLYRSVSKFCLTIRQPNNYCRNLSNKNTFKEVAIPVPWGEIRGKWWGPTESRPILILHGWQDNCGSFDRLMPLLNNEVGYLAIDLPGHGYSSRLPAGIPYTITEYLSTIKYVEKYLGWPRVALMGHSLGSAVSFTYTMIYPDKVDFLVCIDGAKPLVPKVTKNRLTRALDAFLKNSDLVIENREPPSYTIEEMKRIIHQPNDGAVDIDVAHYLMERNIAPSKTQPGKYYFTRDPRLKAEAFTYITQEEILYTVRNMKCPIFVAKAKGSHYFEQKENFYEVLDVLKKNIADFEFNYIEGTHNVHLNNPEAELSSLIDTFISKHNLIDRSVSTGIKEDIVVEEIDLLRNKI